jgi:predicted GIY-YIG superfamily endonuclease
MSWSIYLISTGSRTYIGSTTDVVRRLRQHNGEIVGGARSTSKHKGKWKLMCHVSGFQNRSEACRWEKLAKVRAPRGLEARHVAFVQISLGICPPSRTGRKDYTVPSGLTLVLTDMLFRGGSNELP